MSPLRRLRGLRQVQRRAHSGKPLPSDRHRKGYQDQGAAVGRVQGQAVRTGNQAGTVGRKPVHSGLHASWFVLKNSTNLITKLVKTVSVDAALV